MMDATNKQQQEVTILRIKRKRNEEPLDALVVESRRKKSKGGLNALEDGMNVFQFAETVEPDTWDDEKRKQDLETRLSTLARESSRKKLQTSSPRPESRPEFPPEPILENKKPDTVDPTQPTTPSLSAPLASSTTAKDESEPKPKSSPCSPPSIDDQARKYTIVSSTSVGSPDLSERPDKRAHGRPNAPPKIHSYKDLLKASVTMYDAIPTSASLSSVSSSEPSIDPEVAKFLPMLKDYLNISGDSAMSPLSSGIMANGAQDDDDYVWDVFYSRPATFKDLYYGAGGKINIGTVTGLPDDGYGSSDESDIDDEDDEDSNAEDWYKNDYPDEEDQRSDESDGSDIFHEDSDFEDAVHDRGRWHLDLDS